MLALSACSASRILISSGAPEVPLSVKGDELSALSLATSPGTTEDFRKTQVFGDVDWYGDYDDTETPDLILSEFSRLPKERQCNGGVLMVLTLGFVPYRCHLDVELAFTIRPFRGSGEVRVHDTFVKETTFGWVAAPMIAGQMWSGAYGRQDADHIRVLLLARREELLALAHSSRTSESGRANNGAPHQRKHPRSDVIGPLPGLAPLLSVPHR